MPSRPWLRAICLDTVLPLIFESLSASSAASFLTILKELKLPISLAYFERKYVRLIRDIPEYSPWIEACVGKQHRVFLIGSDVNLWRERLYNPGRYWRRYPEGFTQEKPLRLWLAVRVSRGFNKQPQRHNTRKDAEYWITTHADAVTGTEASRALHAGIISTKSNLIPLPGDARSRTTHSNVVEERSWRLASKRNENNLSLVWAEVKSNNQTPHVQMCPLQASDRCSTDIMGGNHGFRCAYESPGSILRHSRTSPRQVIPEVPYLEIGKLDFCWKDKSDNGRPGQPAAAIVIEDGDDPESFAISIKLDCCSSRSQSGKVLGPAIRAELQGIPW